MSRESVRVTRGSPSLAEVIFLLLVAPSQLNREPPNQGNPPWGRKAQSVECFAGAASCSRAPRPASSGAEAAPGAAGRPVGSAGLKAAFQIELEERQRSSLFQGQRPSLLPRQQTGCHAPPSQAAGEPHRDASPLSRPGTDTYARTHAHTRWVA